ncbi:secreted protein, partial [Candidatus Magnetobacterium bavaricum]
MRKISFTSKGLCFSIMFLLVVMLTTYIEAGQTELTPIDCPESGNSVQIRYGEYTKNCQIDTAADIDKFQFSATPGDNIRLIVKSSKLMVLEVWDQEGNKVANVPFISSHDMTIDKTGTYTIAIQDYGYDEYGYDYVLRIESIPPIYYSPATVKYGTSISEKIDSPTDMDFFLLGGAKGNKIRLIVKSDVLMVLEVWEPEGNKVANVPFISSSDMTLNKTGTYTIALQDYSYDESNYDYTFSVECMSTSCDGVQPPGPTPSPTPIPTPTPTPTSTPTPTP